MDLAENAGIKDTIEARGHDQLTTQPQNMTLEPHMRARMDLAKISIPEILLIAR